MFVMTAKISKPKLIAAAIVLVAVVLLIVLLVSGGSGKKAALEAAPAGATNDERVAFLATFGWNVNAEPKEVQKVRIPENTDNKVFSRYNELQRSQGFDLSACCGKQVARYTYAVTNYPGRAQGVQANLYVCGDRPAAGDIFCAGADGFQTGLAFPKS